MVKLGSNGIVNRWACAQNFSSPTFFLLKNCYNKTWLFFLLLLTYYQLFKMFAGIFLSVANLTLAEVCVEGDSGF